MRTLYFDCGMGASGDMIVAALLEIHPNPDAFIQRFNQLELHQYGLGSIRLVTDKVTRCGLMGTRAHMLLKPVDASVEVEETCNAPDLQHCHEHEHCHEHDHVNGMSMGNIETLLNGIDISSEVRNHCLAVFGLIASSEAHAHGCPVEQIHFHEIGQLDAVADVLAACMLINEMHPEKIFSSPVCLGKGTVKCAHGILPVPAPATAHLLIGAPVYQGTIEAELCTPTGAALLIHFVDEFCSIPMMKVEAIGCGMGTREFENRPNMLGDMNGMWHDGSQSVVNPQDLAELHVNVDDMTGEQIGYAVEILLEEGAKDAWSIPIVMKKGRPAHTIACLVEASQTEKFARLMLLHTSSFGVRIFPCQRFALPRTVEAVNTPYGAVHLKKSHDSEISRHKWEYDDVASIAKRLKMSVLELAEKLEDSLK